MVLLTKWPHNHQKLIRSKSKNQRLQQEQRATRMKDDAHPSENPTPIDLPLPPFLFCNFFLLITISRHCSIYMRVEWLRLDPIKVALRAIS